MDPVRWFEWRSSTFTLPGNRHGIIYVTRQEGRCCHHKDYTWNGWNCPVEGIVARIELQERRFEEVRQLPGQQVVAHVKLRKESQIIQFGRQLPREHVRVEVQLAQMGQLRER